MVSLKITHKRCNPVNSYHPGNTSLLKSRDHAYQQNCMLHLSLPMLKHSSGKKSTMMAVKVEWIASRQWFRL